MLLLWSSSLFCRCTMAWGCDERLSQQCCVFGDSCWFRTTYLVVGLGGRALLEISMSQLLVSYRTLDRAGGRLGIYPRGEATTRMHF